MGKKGRSAPARQLLYAKITVWSNYARARGRAGSGAERGFGPFLPDWAYDFGRKGFRLVTFVPRQAPEANNNFFRKKVIFLPRQPSRSEKKGRRPAPWRFPFGSPSCCRAAARTVVAPVVRCLWRYSNSFITDSILRRISSVQSRPMLPSWVWCTSLTGRYSPRWTSMPTRR